MKKERSKYAALFYLLLILLGAWAGLLVGVATDEARDEDDRFILTLMQTPDFESLETYKKITDDESNALRGALIGGGVVLLAILHITTTRKRFHRRGVEHGSAEWGSLAEKKKLADRGLRIRENKGFMKIHKPFLKFKRLRRNLYIYVKLDGPASRRRR